MIRRVLVLLLAACALAAWTHGRNNYLLLATGGQITLASGTGSLLLAQ